MAAPLRRILGFVSARFREPSTCEACGQPFTCGATLAGCWCTEVALTDDVRADLRQRYRKCLCRPCLEAAAQPATSATTPV
jgi:hypothetical protein